MRFLKQSTSVDLPIGPFLDSTDGVTAETALTLTQPDIRLKKNGAAWAQKAAAQTLTHEENGYYEVTLDATDTDTLGHLRLAVAETGALPIWEDFMVMPANVWDALFGADKLQVHADEITAGLITAAAIATGAIDADAIAADAITAAKIANGAIDAATFAAGAIDAAALAADAAGEIADAVWDEDATGHQTQGSFGQAIGDPGADADTIWGLANTNLDAPVSSRATPAQVNTEVLDVLNVDTFAEPGQEAPPATTTLVKKIGYLYKAFRNRITQTATTLSLYGDDAATVDQKSTVSDNGTTYDRGELGTGP